MKYLRNCWYQIAWAEELSHDVMLKRTVLGEDIVMFRKEGAATALRDRCPHRFAPLSLGKLEAGHVTCPYHGLRFSNTGACVHNPHGAAVSALAVQRYPVIERHDALWIWMGDVAAADAEMIPNLSFIDTCPETAKIRSYTPVAAHYELLTDNIVDLSHADYLHSTSLGSGFNTRTKAKITEADDRIIVAWEADSEEAPPAFQIASPAKLWTVVAWFAPAVMVLRAGGHPVDDPAVMIDSLNLHSMTPATDASSHYFACNTRSFNVEDAAFTAILKRQLLHAFQVEDKPMVEAVQRNMGTTDLWSLHPAMFPSDRGAVCVRRRLAKMIAAETRL